MYATLICAATVLIPFAYGQLNGEVRLYGSDQLLQVYYEGKWGFVCDDYFDHNLNGAKVVCKQLGITPPTGYPKMFKGITTDSDVFLLDDVTCNGNEAGISDCYRHNRPWGYDNCGTTEGVSVHCSQTRYCASNPHGCSEICVYGSRGYDCSSCPEGYTNTTVVSDRSRCTTGTDIDECFLRTHNCSHYCRNGIGGYYCVCPSGLLLDTDLRTCVEPCDILNQTCSHTCVNAGNTYNCSCPDGLLLDTDNSTCEGPCDWLNHTCSHTCINNGDNYNCSCPKDLQLGPDQRTCIAKGLSVECTTAEMRLSVTKNQRLNGVEPKDLILNDPSCKAAFNKISNAFMFVSKLDQCGMISKELPSAIEYHNTIRTNQQGLISRLPDVNIPVKCVMKRQYTVDKNVIIDGNQNRIDSNELSSNGTYQLSLNFYASENFFSALKPPVTMHLGEKLFFEVAANTSADNLTMILERCYATPADDVKGLSRYIFLENGCPKDPTFETYNSTDALIKRFSLKGFKFNIGDQSGVNFACDVTMCEISDVFSRCRKGCISSGYIVKRHQLGLKDSTKAVRAGPVHII